MGCGMTSFLSSTAAANAVDNISTRLRRARPQQRQPNNRSGNNGGKSIEYTASKPVAAISSAILIQKWYRRYRARLEARNRCTWHIFQSLEYSDEQDQLRLYNLFHDMLTHLDPSKQHSPSTANDVKTVTASPINDDAGKDDYDKLYSLANPDKIKVPANYSGPHIQFPMTVSQLQNLISHFKKKQVLHAHYLIALLHEARQILKTLPNIRHASTLGTQRITVCGDLHGKLHDLLIIFWKNGLPSSDNPYVFNGDFVDRGPQSVEVVVILLSCLLINKTEIYINRGNHEDHVMNLRYGFVKEIMTKYKGHAAKIIRIFQDLFSWLPLATVIDDKILVCHGGVSDMTDLEYLNTIDRHQYISALRPPSADKPATDLSSPPDSGQLLEWRQVLDLLWSDPSSQDGCLPNIHRGGGCYFGPDVTKKFLRKHRLDLLVRSHQCKQDGFEYDHNNQLLTIFSASNYYEFGSNRGAYLIIYKDHKPQIIQFQAQKKYGRKLTFNQHIGFVERAALRGLLEKICASKTLLLENFKPFDPQNKGLVRVTDWCKVMSSAFNGAANLPWLSLRSKLTKSSKLNGFVDYRSTFDDFKLQLKYTSNDDGSSLTEALYRNKENLETIFRVIDKDHSGFISLDEFEEACRMIGAHTSTTIPHEHVMAMARTMDLNNDGQIDFNEFLETFRIVDRFGRELNELERRTSDDEIDNSPSLSANFPAKPVSSAGNSDSSGVGQAVARKSTSGVTTNKPHLQPQHNVHSQQPHLKDSDGQGRLTQRRVSTGSGTNSASTGVSSTQPRHLQHHQSHQQ